MGTHIPITLHHPKTDTVRSLAINKLALVCEGGGQRGIFTAGVLDVFKKAGFDQFDLLLGTSAGAQNLSAFVCQQPGYARRVITHYTTSSEFFNPLRFVRGGSLIDLDWLINITTEQMPLDFAAGEHYLANQREFLICACRSDDFTPDYFSVPQSDWLMAIKASSAIPGIYRQPVELNGITYLDGGVSDAIPVEEAYRRGANTIVVIRTTPIKTYYTQGWFQRVERWVDQNHLPQMLQLMQQHEKSYLRIQQFIDNPPEGVTILEIAPFGGLQSRALGSKPAALSHDYDLGRRTGRHFLTTVGRYL